jgi:hypothetical protein
MYHRTTFKEVTNESGGRSFQSNARLRFEALPVIPISLNPERCFAEANEMTLFEHCRQLQQLFP